MISKLTLLLALLLLVPAPVRAGQKERVWKVGFLSSRAKPENPKTDYHNGFVDGMRELGYVEGKNLIIEWRFAEGKPERYPGLLNQLIQIPFDVLVTDGTPSTLAAQKATKTIPIVFGSAADPDRSGIVSNLARPGGNTTGIAVSAGETGSSTKQLELLKTAASGISLVAVLMNPSNLNSVSALARLQTVAKPLNLDILAFQASNPREIEMAFSSMARSGANGLLILGDSVLWQHRNLISHLAARHRLPGIASNNDWPDAGLLLSYGHNRMQNYHRAATYVHKILKGANPGELPVEQPTTFDLNVNKKTAKQLGLTIPPELLVLANRVIE